MELRGGLIHACLRGITAERSDMQQRLKEDPSISKNHSDKRIREKPNKARKGSHIRPNERKDLNNQSLWRHESSSNATKTKCK